MSERPIKRALVSVSNKEHLLPLANELIRFGVEIISTGGTYQYLTQNQIKVKRLEEFTLSKEVFGGRVKTLGVPVMGSILYRRDHSQDQLEAKELNLEDIDLVVCNFYPFEDLAKKFLHQSRFNQKESLDISDLYEKIDIGGPTMVRAAAKNFSFVTTLSSTKDYLPFMKEFRELGGKTSINLRKRFSLKAFTHTFLYEKEIASTLGYLFAHEFEDSKLRYGENPHQKAFILSNKQNFLKSQGKELSYNNHLDLDAALSLIKEINFLALTHFKSSKTYASVVVKHLNPCGVSLASSPRESLKLAIEGDPVSSFGGIYALNFTVDEEIAIELTERFIELIIAPKFTEGAKNILAKKKNLRAIEISEDSFSLFSENQTHLNFKHLSTGEFLIQEEDFFSDSRLESVSKNEFPERLYELAYFGIAVCKWGKSNAIAIVHQNDHGYYLVGTGFGQQNRIDSMEKLAIPRMKEKKGINLENTILISDAFFPFSDSIKTAGQHGIKYIIQPGGSIKDSDVIQSANEMNISMAFTHKRHFKH